MISSSDNHLIIKISPRPRVSPNDKSSPEHDMIQALRSLDAWVGLHQRRKPPLQLLSKFIYGDY